MRNVRIYQPGAYEPGDTLRLTPDAGQHVGVVLRMQPGQSIILFCGDNREFSATLTDVHKKNVTVIINDVKLRNRESPRHLHLAQSLSKGDKMEWIIQKTVELGVTSITPLLTDRSVIRLDDSRLIKKQAQWQAIAISACEQSGRNQLPLIHTPMTLALYLNQSQPQTRLLLHPDAPAISETLPDGDITLLIGPEGGFNEEEVRLAMNHGCQGLRLGPRVLRTETAAIAAISVLQAMGGDLL